VISSDWGGAFFLQPRWQRASVRGATASHSPFLLFFAVNSAIEGIGCQGREDPNDMFDFFKSKQKRVAERASKDLLDAVGKILDAVTLQLDFLYFFERKQKADILDPYFVRYVFGMFDAVTPILPMHVRRKFSKYYVDHWFTRFMIGEFGLNETNVRPLLDELWDIYGKGLCNPERRDRAIMDGGFDGMLRLKEGQPNGLLRYFGFDFAGQVSPEEFQAFRAFHFRDVSQR
jgi:hypothetical protein